MFCIAVPVKNGGKQLPRFIDALMAQSYDGVIYAVLQMNSCTDDTVDVADRLQKLCAPRLRLHLDQAIFSPGMNHIGSSRRRAMELATRVVSFRQHGIIISTDVGTHPPPDWIDANLSAFDSVDDIVGGRLSIGRGEPSEPIASSNIGQWPLWARYWEMVRAIEDAIDPRSWDLPPRHGDHSSASLALTVSLLKRAGGVPAIPIGADQALIRNAQRVGGRLKHPLQVRTQIITEAQDDADRNVPITIRRRQVQDVLPSKLFAPDFDQWRRRAQWRRDIRQRPAGNILVANLESLLPVMIPTVPITDLVTTQGSASMEM